MIPCIVNNLILYETGIGLLVRHLKHISGNPGNTINYSSATAPPFMKKSLPLALLLLFQSALGRQPLPAVRWLPPSPIIAASSNT